MCRTTRCCSTNSSKSIARLKSLTKTKQKGLRDFSRSPHAWGLSFNFRYYGHGAGGFGNETGHGVTGMTSPLLLMASMQFFSISWPGRLGFPASTSWFPGPVILSHAAAIRPLTVMCEHRSNALPSTNREVDVQLQRCQLRRQHVGHVRRVGAQQPGSEVRSRCW